MNTKSFFALLLLVLTSCRVVIEGETQPASQPIHTAVSSPEKTFEVFWQTFEDQYAFFETRKTDWHKTYEQYRQMVNSNTSPDSLFSILCAMVEPLQDDHVEIYFIEKNRYRNFTAAKPSRFLKEFPDEKSMKAFWHMVDQTLDHNGFHNPVDFGPKEDGVSLFQYSASPSVGYIRFTRCYVTEKTENDRVLDPTQAGALFDVILQKIGKKEKIILDIRNNEGGLDEFSNAIASRFADTTRIGYYKQKRNGGYNDFTSLVPILVRPQRNAFTKPVVILTNDQSCSAADVFALMMKALPNTTLIGENSTGIYSDMYVFMLPNGWYASLSNERYLSPDMKCYEGTGTPVDIEVRNTRNDLVTMRDPVLTKALQF
ncbi:MAG: S41 family peptidase [Cyclobacteriaceae bacterium]